VRGFDRCLPKYCHFRGILSIRLGIGASWTVHDVGGFLSAPLHIPLLHQSGQEVVGRSWGHVREFCYRAIRVMYGIQGGFSMMVAIGVDMPLMRSL